MDFILYRLLYEIMLHDQQLSLFLPKYLKMYSSVSPPNPNAQTQNEKELFVWINFSSYILIKNMVQMSMTLAFHDVVFFLLCLIVKTQVLRKKKIN